MSTPQPLKEVYLATPGYPRELVRLGKPLNKGGGAGVVYSIQGDAARVVKIYHTATLAKDGREYAAKLDVMLAHPPQLVPIQKPMDSPVSGPIVQIAWPLGIARDNKGNFVGFSMPAIDVAQTIELENVLIEKQAKLHGLRHDLGSKLVLAHNLAGVVSSIHAEGHAIVDLKPPNLRFYMHDLYMAVLDCDGFAVSVPGTSMAAPQVTSDYLAPEFQKGGLIISNSQHQDRFALAVIIFKLLNFGIHPYQGVPKGNALPDTIEGKISAGLYAYGIRPHKDIGPTPASGHEALPQDIRNLFDRAFGKVSSQRPTANEWKEVVLNHVTHSRSKCSQGHLHFIGCPCGQCIRDGVIQAALSSNKPTIKKSRQAKVPVQAKVTQPIRVAVSPSAPSSSGKSKGTGKWIMIGLALFGGYLWYSSGTTAPSVEAASDQVAMSSAPDQQSAGLLPYWGILFAQGSDDGKIYLGAVATDSPAGKAGLLAGDRVVRIAGIEPQGIDDLKRALQSSGAAVALPIVIRRSDREAEGTLVPEMLPATVIAERTRHLESMPLPKVGIQGLATSSIAAVKGNQWPPGAKSENNEQRTEQDKTAVSETIDQQHKRLLETECGGNFFCGERLRWKLCDGKWSPDPPSGQRICVGASAQQQ